MEYLEIWWHIQVTAMSDASDALALDGPWKGHYPLAMRVGDERVMRVSGPGWTAQAAWQQRHAGATWEWTCRAATPPVDWMMRMGSEQAKAECVARGLAWTWEKKA